MTTFLLAKVDYNETKEIVCNDGENEHTGVVVGLGNGRGVTGVSSTAIICSVKATCRSKRLLYFG